MVSTSAEHRRMRFSTTTEREAARGEGEVEASGRPREVGPRGEEEGGGKERGEVDMALLEL